MSEQKMAFHAESVRVDVKKFGTVFKTVAPGMQLSGAVWGKF